jgi:flagellar assembly protein FliH
MTKVRPISEILPQKDNAKKPSWLFGQETRRAQTPVPPPPRAKTTPPAPPAEPAINAKKLEEENKRARAQVEAIVAKYTEGIERLQQTHRDMMQPYVDSVSMAIVIARAILRRELALDPQILIDNVQELLAALGDDKPISLRIGPTDLQIIQRIKPELLDGRIELIEDPSLDLGGCIAETPTRTADGTLETRLAAIASSLYQQLSEEPST